MLSDRLRPPLQDVRSSAVAISQRLGGRYIPLETVRIEAIPARPPCEPYSRGGWRTEHNTVTSAFSFREMCRACWPALSRGGR
eukprot:53797-Eustigmatos_ZCMA.PRE.1